MQALSFIVSSLVGLLIRVEPMTTIARHKKARLASDLLYGSLALGIGITIVNYALAWPVSWADSWLVYAVLAASILFKAGLYYAVRLNKQWAKWFLLGFFLFTNTVQVVTYLTYPITRQQAMRPTLLIPTIIINGLIIGALILLFRKSAAQKD
jgi:ABC-type iron transport system FetAB permease component